MFNDRITFFKKAPLFKGCHSTLIELNMKFFSRKKDKDTKKEADKATKVKDGKKKEEKVSMKELYEDKKHKKIDNAAGGKEDKKEGKSRKARKYGNAYRILVKPLVTEKASAIGVENKYIFAVAPKANKIEIAKAIQEVYGIKPLAINIIKVTGKKTRYGKVAGKRKDWKKAIITLPEGKSIKVYEGV